MPRIKVTSSLIHSLLFGQNFNNFCLILRIENKLALFRALEQKTYFCKKLEMRAGLINGRQRHNKYTARFLIKRIKIHRIVRNTDACNKITHGISFAMRNGNTMLHTC